MATHRIPILGFGAVPDTSGTVFFDGYDNYASNDLWDRMVLVFEQGSARDGCNGGFTVPKNYSGTPKFVIIWTSAATSGDVEWDFDYRAVGGDNDESLDQTGYTGDAEQLGSNDTAITPAQERMEFILTPSDNFSIDDEVEFTIFRDQADAGDTMAAAALVFQVMFEYSDE